jgi:hypothetical protein
MCSKQEAIAEHIARNALAHIITNPAIWPPLETPQPSAHFGSSRPQTGKSFGEAPALSLPRRLRISILNSFRIVIWVRSPEAFDLNSQQSIGSARAARPARQARQARIRSVERPRKTSLMLGPRRSPSLKSQVQYFTPPHHFTMALSLPRIFLGLRRAPQGMARQSLHRFPSTND